MPVLLYFRYQKSVVPLVFQHADALADIHVIGHPALGTDLNGMIDLPVTQVLKCITA